MNKTLIKNALIVNEGKITKSNLLINDNIIEEIGNISDSSNFHSIIDAEGLYLLPGIIDDHVHFREPGFALKADFASESAAAVAGGVTSVLEMPNTNPKTTTNDLLNQKIDIASQKSLCNFGFYLGATNDNLNEIIKADPTKVCGVKLFMGSSTGNMLVDKKESLSNLFKESPILIAVHAEDESIIAANTIIYKEKYGENIPIELHPLIRSEEACYKSSSLAIELASKYNTRLHILHLSTAKELSLLLDKPINDKKITAEVCIPHLWFDNSFYSKLGTKIKINPAIKSSFDKEQLIEALKTNKLDVIATDHAPHLIDEKNNSYFKAASGAPMIQHSLVAMLELYHQGKISLENIVHKMCHNPSILFNIKNRGFIRKGYFADLVLVDLNKEQTVTKDSLIYKCKWSALEGTKFNSSVIYTFVNGNLTYNKGNILSNKKGIALKFENN